MNYMDINTEDTCNGIGLRVVIWVSGCGFQCHNCQNPQAWNVNDGEVFSGDVREELFSELDKNYITGLTLTGGDPLYEPNLEAVLDLVKDFRMRYADNKTIWLYTGFLWEDIFHGDIVTFSGTTPKMKRREIVSQCDILVDGRYVDELRDITLKWRGSSNQRVIDVKESLRQNKVILWCD